MLALPERRKELFIKTLLEHYHPGFVDKVLAKRMSTERVQAIASISVAVKNPSYFIERPDALLTGIHYSWILEALEDFPEVWKTIFLAALPKSSLEFYVKACQNQLLLKKKLSPVAIKFFQHLLFERLEESNEIIKRELLSPHPLLKLLEIDLHLIFEIIDLLGLYDLSAKLKYVIDKKTLNQIYECFSPVKKKFLMSIVNRSDSIILTKVDLSNWSGDPIELKKMVHKRGLLRLGKALSGSPKDFMWHITRKLDTGRGRLLMHYYSEEGLAIGPALREQILLIINILTKKNPS